MRRTRHATLSPASPVSIYQEFLSVSFSRCVYRGMLMTACDVSAITKPWEIQRRVMRRLLLSACLHCTSIAHHSASWPHGNKLYHQSVVVSDFIQCQQRCVFILSHLVHCCWQTAELVASEFFEQGDKERTDLQLEPMVSGLAIAVCTIRLCAQCTCSLLFSLHSLLLSFLLLLLLFRL